MINELSRSFKRCSIRVFRCCRTKSAAADYAFRSELVRKCSDDWANVAMRVVASIRNGSQLHHYVRETRPRNDDGVLLWRSLKRSPEVIDDVRHLFETPESSVRSDVHISARNVTARPVPDPTRVPRSGGTPVFRTVAVDPPHTHARERQRRVHSSPVWASSPTNRGDPRKEGSYPSAAHDPVRDNVPDIDGHPGRVLDVQPRRSLLLHRPCTSVNVLALRARQVRTEPADDRESDRRHAPRNSANAYRRAGRVAVRPLRPLTMLQVWNRRRDQMRKFGAIWRLRFVGSCGFAFGDSPGCMASWPHLTGLAARCGAAPPRHGAQLPGAVAVTAEGYDHGSNMPHRSLRMIPRHRFHWSVLILVWMLFAGMGCTPDEPSRRVIVLAAASTCDCIEEIADLFRKTASADRAGNQQRFVERLGRGRSRQEFLPMCTFLPARNGRT